METYSASVTAPAKLRATYQDVIDAPEHMVAELIDGELYLSPRPKSPHAHAMSILGGLLVPPFGLGRGGPGGWTIYVEPEIRIGENVLVPDLAGWRHVEGVTFTAEIIETRIPDWICEIASPSTQRLDRVKKLPIYAGAGIGHAWIVQPLDRTLEILRNHENRWLVAASHGGDESVRAEPFEDLELALGDLWIPE